MRKLRSRVNRTIKEVAILLTVMAAFIFVHLATSIPMYVYFGICVVGFIGLCIWAIVKSKSSIKKIINERGYVFLVLENDLEHRYIAKKLLSRELKTNEVVHHINGKRIDNAIRNLCLMDSEKHELFHSWLSWKKKKSGSYPSFADQRRILTEEYNGILLEHLCFTKRSEEKNHIQTKSTQLEETTNASSEIDLLRSSQFLFEELRKERLRISREKKIPAYMIFYDRTLKRMAQAAPDTDALMLKTIGPSKYLKYGPAFLIVVKKFKANSVTNSNKRDIG